MKEQYIKQVKKELSLPCKVKKEVLRDLNEVFTSALEHGETEQQVIQRLGTPREFADSTAEQFGIDNTISKKTKNDYFCSCRIYNRRPRFFYICCYTFRESTKRGNRAGKCNDKYPY